ncbi:DNA ligase [Moritella marina ATCC 15381]|uniref:DNA ligase n=1 Tax=Moritella marina ATCC 15381 TaxID=1202962 RepID=A0A5J6WH22_MORMI|nr:zinc ribbon domain-containing protein [Moritella marina]QFI37379.1 DNA ligase [Moritella marina ATCC 15381]
MSNTNSNENNCNQCHEPLAWKAGLYHCVSCNQDYKKISFCPDCNAELEKLQACGATNYFCNTCHSLKSKSRVSHQFKSCTS